MKPGENKSTQSLQSGTSTASQSSARFKMVKSTTINRMQQLQLMLITYICLFACFCCWANFTFILLYVFCYMVGVCTFQSLTTNRMTKVSEADLRDESEKSQIQSNHFCTLCLLCLVALIPSNLLNKPNEWLLQHLFSKLKNDDV